MSSKTQATDKAYWAHYTGLQHVKHRLLEKYLGAWFPILASSGGRVLYVDCHAGRGRHDTGHPGSPILAIQTLLNHRARTRILQSTKVYFAFFENNSQNYDLLCHEIQVLGQLPNNVRTFVFRSDYESNLREIITGLLQSGGRMAPAFVFVDPYGFALSMDLLNGLLQFPKCELFVNFMYHYVDLAMHNPSLADITDRLFGTTSWRGLTSLQDHKHRAQETIALFSGQLNAQFVTHMHMFGKTNVLKYVLLHATNHRRGRERMKDAMWSVVPEGRFEAFERHNPNQLVLIQPDPSLQPLVDRLWDDFAGQSVSMSKLYDWLVTRLYRRPHLHNVLTELRKQGSVKFNGTSRRKPFNSNPTITFSHDAPSLG